MVVNDDGTLAGIVAPTDILRALERGLDLRDASRAEPSLEYVDLRKIG